MGEAAGEVTFGNSSSVLLVKFEVVDRAPAAGGGFHRDANRGFAVFDLDIRNRERVPLVPLRVRDGRRLALAVRLDEKVVALLSAAALRLA